MSEKNQDKNQVAWLALFEKYSIIEKINQEGFFKIKSDQINKFREARLMTKFDHSENLPKIFIDNKLSILPISRGEYIIGHFALYHKFEPFNFSSKIELKKMPSIESIVSNAITSESVALNCAYISGILQDFLNEKSFLYPTASGRMTSEDFAFNVSNIKNNDSYLIDLSKSQIEIDGTFEGDFSIAIVEAKVDLSNDFLVRQVYYPYRLFCKKFTKKIRPVFFEYSNGIFYLYEYEFKELDNYNSIHCVQQKRYCIDDYLISRSEIIEILNTTLIISESNSKLLPQADKFERVINLCEILQTCELTKEEITENYAFDKRQTAYYANSAVYLDLIELNSDYYQLSKIGKKIFSLSLRERQLEFCRIILSHEIFNYIFKSFFENGVFPSNDEAVLKMKKIPILSEYSDSTLKRRYQTIQVGFYGLLL